jgi:hexosaminidase
MSRHSQVRTVLKCSTAGALLLLVHLAPSRAQAGDPADTHPELHLIPWPKSLEAGDGHLRLSAETRIVAEEQPLQPLARVLAHELRTLTGLDLHVAKGAPRPGDIVLRLDPQLRAGERILSVRKGELIHTMEGAHTIDIGDNTVVTGFDYRALAEGTSTLLQLLGQAGGEFHLPKLRIKDWPHADYCGAMLDVARQDHSLDDIRKVVQLCRLYKTRYLQLHLTDDQGWTFPSTKYP